jgi:hypothetical protein
MLLWRRIFRILETMQRVGSMLYPKRRDCVEASCCQGSIPGILETRLRKVPMLPWRGRIPGILWTMQRVGSIPSTEERPRRGQF